MIVREGVKARLFFSCLTFILCSTASYSGYAMTNEPVTLQTQPHGAVRVVDLATFPPGKQRREIAGPTSGLQSANLVVGRLPPGKSRGGLQENPVDKVYFVLRGTLQVELGAEISSVDADTLVVVPARTPYHIWNTGPSDAITIEVIAPAWQGKAVAAKARKIEDASSLIRKPTPEGYVHPDPRGPGGKYALQMAAMGFGAQWLQARDIHGDFHFAVSEVHSQPGASSPPWHFHPFDQVYYVMEGTMAVQMGTKSYDVKANSFVIIPAGTVHRNWNSGSVVEKHLNFILPEPPNGEAWDIAVDLKGDITKQGERP